MDSANIAEISLASAAEITKRNLNGILEQTANIIGIYDGRGRLTVELKDECNDCSSLSIYFRKQMIILVSVHEKRDGIYLTSRDLSYQPEDCSRDGCPGNAKIYFSQAKGCLCVPAGNKPEENGVQKIIFGITEALKPIL